MTQKEIIHIRQNQPRLLLTWIMNNICTNHCDYCPPTLHMGTNHSYDWEIAKDFLQRLFKRYPNIHVSISGGEPTLSPFFPELVKLFYDNGHTVGITSNAARSVSYWEEISPYLSYICFSYHPSHEDPNFLEKALAASEKTQVSIRVMMDSRYWDKSYDFFNKVLNLNKFSVESVKILPEMASRHVGDSYTQEQLDWLAKGIRVDPATRQWQEIRKNNPGFKPATMSSSFYYDDGSVDLIGDSNYIVSSGQNDFRGWSCNIGIESLYISFDGWIKKGNCMQGGILFHINDHVNHKLPTTGEMCNQGICHCGTDVLITKTKIFDKNSEFVKHQGVQGMQVHTDEEYKNSFKQFFEKKTTKTTIKILPKNI